MFSHVAHRGTLTLRVTVRTHGRLRAPWRHAGKAVQSAAVRFLETHAHGSLYEEVEYFQERAALRNQIHAQRLEEALRSEGFILQTDTLKCPSVPPVDRSTKVDVDPMELFLRWRHDVTLPPLPEADVEGILAQAEELLSQLDGSVIDLEVPLVPPGVSPSTRDDPPSVEDAKIVIVGDTHGQMSDLMHIFQEHGPPSPSCTYLFNGDISDRGTQAVEIWLLVLAFKLRYPDNVHVLRGNHENHMMNKRPTAWGGGFREEVNAKYGPTAYDRFQRLFMVLPVFAVVQNDIFVVHAGLGRIREVTIDRLRRINYRRHYTCTPSTDWTEDEALLFDAQWSDPSPAIGLTASKRGKNVINFGPDVTEAFLRKNDLSLCIRSHEVPRTRRGFHFMHGRRLLTIFSASNYGMLKNRGAVAIVRGPPDPDQALHSTPEHEESANPTPNQPDNAFLELASGVTVRCVEHTMTVAGEGAGYRQVRSAAKVRQEFEVRTKKEETDEATRYALGIIVMVRERLLKCFQMADSDRTGYLRTPVIIDLLKKNCAGDFNWMWLLTSLADFGPQVAYSNFLNAIEIRWGHLDSDQAASLAEAMLHADLHLDCLTDLFDYHHDGLVTAEEVSRALTFLLPALSPALRLKVRQLVCGNDSVAVSDLVQRLMAFAPPPKFQPWVVNELAKLRELIQTWAGPEDAEPHRALLKFFRFIDNDGNGILSNKEVLQGFAKLDQDFGSEGLESLAEHIDFSKDGSISFLEFVWAMTPAPASADPTCPVIEELTNEENFNSLMPHDTCTALVFLYRGALLHGCQLLDTSGSGKVSAQDFLTMVEVLSRVLDRPLTKSQIQALGAGLGDQDLDYADVLYNFSITFDEKNATRRPDL